MEAYISQVQGSYRQFWGGVRGVGRGLQAGIEFAAAFNPVTSVGIGLNKLGEHKYGEAALLLPCCGGRSAAGKDPPFRRVVALGYYDGPTAGAAECAVCSVEFRFEMIDQSTRRDVRAFSLAPLPGGSVGMVVAACPQGLPPQWPVWVPRWEFLSEADRAASEQRIEQILEKAGPPQHAVAWSDITKGLVAARGLAPDDMATVKDWFAFLGLAR